MEYEILLTAIFHVGLCNKFRDQSSVKGLSGQWVEFQKVLAVWILTTKISICVDRRYLYFFPDRKSTKLWTNSYALERNSGQKMLGFVMTGRRKRKPRWKIVYLSSMGNFTTQCDFRGISILSLTKISIGNPKTQIRNPRKNEFLWFVLSVKFVAFFWNFGLHVDRTLSVKFTVQKFPNHGVRH